MRLPFPRLLTLRIISLVVLFCVLVFPFSCCCLIVSSGGHFGDIDGYYSFVMWSVRSSSFCSDCFTTRISLRRAILLSHNCDSNGLRIILVFKPLSNECVSGNGIGKPLFEWAASSMENWCLGFPLLCGWICMGLQGFEYFDLMIAT